MILYYVFPSLYLCLWKEKVNKRREECEENGERKEGEGVEQRNEDQGEDQTHSQVGGPVDEHNDRGGGGAGALCEHFSCDEPGDGPVPESKKHDKNKCCGDEKSSDVLILSDDDQYRHHECAN